MIFILVFNVHRYAKDWAYSRSLALTIVIILLMLCIGFAVCRGTYNIYYIYLCGNDPSLVRKAHQAGVILKRWTHLRAM